MQTFRADIEAANDNRTQTVMRWVLGLLSVFLVVATVGYFSVKDYLFEGLPPLPDKATMWEMNLKPNVTLMDHKGVVIGHRGPFIGKPLTLDDLPAHVPNAFLAIEDERFYEHGGVDRKAIMRAFFENTKSGTTRQGGSTLTQQLVKNMLLSPEQNYRRKFQEAWLAYEMEQVLTKDEILELYLNRVALGNRAFGVEAAAQRYFGKSARDLTLQEAAILAGLPKAPSRYDPSRNYDGAWDRAKLVLQRMLANNLITLTELSEAETNPPTLAEKKDPVVDPALMGYAFDMLSERAKELVGHKHQDLVITTTLDAEFQKMAHEALDKTIATHGKSRSISEGAMVMYDNSDGGVRVLIGGRDYNKSQFNRAAQAKRQPGSSFKAFVYATAFEEGTYTPGTVLIDRVTDIKGWAPENYTERYKGPMTVREALKLSINTIAAQVGSDVGPRKIGALAKRFGITTPIGNHDAIALGASEVTLIDLTGAFMVFANEGVRRMPYIIDKIENTQGDVLYERFKTTPERVYALKYAKQMNMILRDVVDSGTGYAAGLGSREVGGKTGTSQDFRDAWFIGFTKQYTTGVWMGNDDNSPMKKVTGGLFPVDAWKAFMRKAHKGLEKLPVADDDPEPETEDVRQSQIYYRSLVSALTEERNMASGNGSAASGGGTNSGTR